MSAGRHPRIGIPRVAGLPAPTLWLPLQDDLLDDSGNGFTPTNATLPSIASITSPVGTGAALFNGSTVLEFADTPLLNSGTGDFTFTAFLRSTGAGWYTSWASKGAYQTSTGAFTLYQWQGDGNAAMGFGNPWRETTGGSFPNSTWLRISVVRSGGTITLYNGTTAAGTISATGLDLTGPELFRVGGNEFGDRWTGHITDFVYIKGTALTLSQITALQTARYSV